MTARPTLAMYWAAGCGGCEVSLLNIGERLLTIDRVFEIVFFPCIADFKLSHLEGYRDGHIDLCLFNGAVNSTENVAMARLLRRKSRTLVAYGSCAHEGCIPALANLRTVTDTCRAVFLDSPSTANPDGVTPRRSTTVPEGELELPALLDTVMALDQVVEVDYTIPGCPPEADRVWEVLESFMAAFAGGGRLPEPGSVLGAHAVAVCEECPQPRHQRRVRAFVRPHEVRPSAELCLLEQGHICLGVATRGGCGALCPKVGMGCRGCYGPPPGVEDQGAKMLAAVASVLEIGSPHDDDAQLAEEILDAAATVVDPAGTFYRFSLAHSLLQRARLRRSQPAEVENDAADQH